MSFDIECENLLMSYLQLALPVYGGPKPNYTGIKKATFDYYGAVIKIDDLILKVTPYNKEKIEEYYSKKSKYELTKEDFIGLEPAEKYDGWSYAMMIIECKQEPTIDDVMKAIGDVRKMASIFNLDKTRIPIKIIGAKISEAVTHFVEGWKKDGYCITAWHPSSKKI